MRHGQNPLTVTERIKEKIQELQPGLPEGVHIVAAYDRTRLIHGAIHTLTEVMWHEMIIASIAILLILSHAAAGGIVLISDDVVASNVEDHRHSSQYHVAGRNHDFDRDSCRSGNRD